MLKYPQNDADIVPGEWTHRFGNCDVHGEVRAARPLNQNGAAYGVYACIWCRRAELVREPPAVETKDTNPKDSAAHTRPVPIGLLAPDLGSVLKRAEGLLKYGENNYMVAGVRASVYIGAATRHMWKWWNGEDYEELTDPKTGEKLQGCHHLDGARESLRILRECGSRGKLTDDRPPAHPDQAAQWAEAETILGNLIRVFGHLTPKHYFQGDE